MASLHKNKLKAASFPGQVLRIGSWELRSRYKTELTCKFYFGKCKIVWEFIDAGGGVAKKMEMKWSDITALHKSASALTITLARKPDFFEEIIIAAAAGNYKADNKTKWQATDDFTGGQATIHNTHYIECAPGVLDKHYDNLIRCNTRLASAAVVDGEQELGLVESISMSDLLDMCSEKDPMISSSTDEVVTDEWMESVLSQVFFNDNNGNMCMMDETLLLQKVNSLGSCIMTEEDQPTTNSVVQEKEANSMMPRPDSLDS